jgi:hypothetical protein
MPTRRTDRTGQTHGAMSVICLAPDQDRRWIIRWDCCGRGEILDSMVVAHYSRKIQIACKTCVKSGKTIKTETMEWTPPPPPPKKPDLRDRTKTTQDAQEEARNQQGIHIPGRGFWPFLFGPMGHRGGHATGAYTPRGRTDL